MRSADEVCDHCGSQHVRPATGDLLRCLTCGKYTEIEPLRAPSQPRQVRRPKFDDDEF